jgi:transposase
MEDARMRPEGTAEELERRRLRAMALLEQGHSLNEVARRVGCNASSVMRWRNACRRGGPAALRPRPTPGRPARLTLAQRKRLVGYLVQGPLAHGFSTDLWTTARVAQVIHRRLGVRFHRDHVGRLLHAVGWTCQKPDKRATQRDEAAIAAWKREAWPRIKKKRRGWAAISRSSTNPDSC